MIYISIGSNIGNRLRNLHTAVEFIRQRILQNTECSIVIETKALLLFNSPLSWDKPFLNMIIAGETNLSPNQLLIELKNIELTMGRPLIYDKWEPRIIDLDILFYSDVIVNTKELTIPHPELVHRYFLQHLLALMGKEPWNYSEHKNNSFFKSFLIEPELVGVVNITKDSFSDGGKFDKIEDAITQINKLAEDGASVIEIGAQSTKPKAYIQPMEEEYSKLQTILNSTQNIIKDKNLTISIDTIHSDIAIKLLEKYNIQWVNDVSGKFEDKSLRYIAEAGCKFCLTHSITIPPNYGDIIPLGINPINYLTEWGEKSIDKLIKKGFSIENIIIDPGIGFGKTIYQNLEILQNIKYMRNLGAKIMVGHSRKSYITSFSANTLPEQRDIETIGISIAIKDKVDFLRVHDVQKHMRAFVAYHVCNKEKLL